jgi:hypothetical protein
MASDVREHVVAEISGRSPKAVTKLREILERFLEALSCMDECFVSGDFLDNLSLPSQVGALRVGGIDMNCPRMRKVARALLALSASRSDEFGNVIVLGDEFYREITSHPIPTDLEAVRVLAGAPAALDLSMWLSYRCFVAAGQESILLFGERELANQLGSIEYSHPRRFCQKLEQWLEMIRVLWPDFPAQINRTGDALLVSRGSAIRSTERIGA